MQNLLLWGRQNKDAISTALIALAYLSLAVVSSFPAFLTFDVSFPAILFFVLFLCAGALVGLDRHNIRVHIVLLALFLRLFLFCLNACFLKVKFETVFEEIAVTFLAALVFLTAYNKEIRIKAVLTPFLLLTDLQIFYAFAASGFSPGKTLIVAGIGRSNYIAAFLLLFICIFLFSRKNLFDILLIGLSVVAFLLTQSFAGYLALGLVLILWVLVSVKWRSLKSVLIFLAVLLIVSLLVAFFLTTKFGQPIFEKIRQKLAYLAEGNITAFSSYRDAIARFSLGNIRRNPVFGSILNIDPTRPEKYRWQGFRTHNFALESLLLYGIVGSLLNLFILYFLIRSFRCKKNLPYLMAFLGALAHGFFEPNFFTLHFELFVWLMIGISLRNADCPGGCRLFGKKQRKE